MATTLNGPETRGEDSTSRKPKRRRHSAVRDFPTGCGRPPVVMQPGEAGRAAFMTVDNPPKGITPEKYRSRVFKRVFAERDYPVIPQRQDHCSASEDVCGKEGSDYVSNGNASLNGGRGNQNSGSEFQAVVPISVNPPPAAAVPRDVSNDNASLNGGRGCQNSGSEFRDTVNPPPAAVPTDISNDNASLNGGRGYQNSGSEFRNVVLISVNPPLAAAPPNISNDNASLNGGRGSGSEFRDTVPISVNPPPAAAAPKDVSNDNASLNGARGCQNSGSEFGNIVPISVNPPPAAVPPDTSNDDASLNGGRGYQNSGFKYRDIVPISVNPPAAAVPEDVSNANASLNGGRGNQNSGSGSRDTVPISVNSAVAVTVPEDVRPISSFVYCNAGELVNFQSGVTRGKVKEVLQLYQEILAEFVEKNEGKSKLEKKRQIHTAAAMQLQGKWVNRDRRLGEVPGVEIGDKFQFRAELNIIGLHRQFNNGIDYMKEGDEILATSIVDSRRYGNDVLSPHELIYTGCGENPLIRGNKQDLGDQKLARGNLALKNSMRTGTPVRVIRRESSGSQHFYYYDGLYTVDGWWQERGQHGKLVFKFLLNKTVDQSMVDRQIENQQVEWTSPKRQGLLMEDIAQGKERMPIQLVNEIDDERPPAFDYKTIVNFPEVYGKRECGGCDCTDGCSDSEDCSCKIKNGREVPYGYDEQVIGRKLLIYECGPCCKCYTSCINRVSQRGIRTPLEVFRTRGRRWGLRSRSHIPRGRFVCEYVGEILIGKEAKPMANDEDSALPTTRWPPSSDCASSTYKGNMDFIIDATRSGNVARFISHSCSPNLFAQRVLYGHGDERRPHVMLFAAKHILPFQELTYDHNARQPS